MAATNGHRSKLSVEQLRFVGFVTEHDDDRDPGGWSSTTNSHIEEKQLELAALLDTMPGYFALARRILEDDGDKK